MRKAVSVAAATVGLLAITAGPAFAHDCFVANKPAGAGSVVTVDLTTSPPTETPNKPNPGSEEKPHGAFVTLVGLPTGPVDVFVKAPEKAGGVIPGATAQAEKGKGCDGKGLELISSCLGA